MANSLPKLVPRSLAEEHAARCKKKRCRLCAWACFCKQKQKPKWLALAMTGSRQVAAGCSACARSSLEGPWAAFKQNPCGLKAHALARHAASKAHQEAEKVILDKVKVAMAPPAKEFSEALDNMRKGGSARQGGTASDRKTKIRFALSESILAKARKDLARAERIALFRDERKGKLCLRYRPAWTTFPS